MSEEELRRYLLKAKAARKVISEEECLKILLENNYDFEKALYKIYSVFGRPLGEGPLNPF